LGHGRREGQSMSEAVLTKAGSGPSADAQPRSGTEMRRVTLITGASGGIGADLARVFARQGHDLVLIARSRTALEALADEIAVPGRPRPLVLVFDLLERNAILKSPPRSPPPGYRRRFWSIMPDLALSVQPPGSIWPSNWRSSISMSARPLI